MSSLLALPLKFSRFGSDAAGLEKLLRFLQALAQIVAAYSFTVERTTPWLLARKQLALGRRYLRFFKFIDCFNVVAGRLGSGDWKGIVLWLEVGKWSCLGMYLALESCTVMDAMEIWNTDWASRMFMESMRFWFYSLCFSLVLGVWELFELSLPGKKPTEAEKRNLKNPAKVKAIALTRREVMTRIVVDGCDLFIPGYTTGWLMRTPATVGWVTVVSTVVASGDIWKRVQRGT